MASPERSIVARLESFELPTQLPAVVRLFRGKTQENGGDFRETVTRLIAHFHSNPIPDFDLEELATNMNICLEAAQEKRRNDPSLQIPESELAALSLYTAHSDFFRVLNAKLRDSIRESVLPFVDIIWLILLGMSKCPVYVDSDMVFRGVRLDLSSIIKENSVITWHQFTSCSTNMNTMQSALFLGEEGPRSIFLIQMATTRPRDIAPFSLHPSEREVVFPPNTRFRVVGSAKLGDNLHQYQLREEEAYDPILRYGVNLADYRSRLHLNLPLIAPPETATPVAENATQTPPPPASTAIVADASLGDDFSSIMNRLCCKDRVVWERVYAIAAISSHGQSHNYLAQAAVIIAGANEYFGINSQLASRYARQCMPWLFQQHDKDAYFCLGEFYYEGIGVEQDEDEAGRYYRMGAEAGSIAAQNELGYYLEYDRGDVNAAVEWYDRSAREGYMQAQYNLAMCYEKGEGVQKDKREAARLFLLAAEQGDSESQFKISNCYRYGNGMAPNHEQAQRWLEMAADGGEKEAQITLGSNYFHGKHVDVDFGKAVRMFRLAADQNSAAAERMLGICYENGKGVEKNEYQAILWYRKAVSKGDKRAQYHLGRCYETGTGVARDVGQAIKFYTLAKKQKDMDAAERLSQLNRQS